MHSKTHDIVIYDFWERCSWAVHRLSNSIEIDNGDMSDHLTIAGRTFNSRLFVGTGKYRSKHCMARCHEISGTEMVTLAVRRVNLTDKSKESELDFIDRRKDFHPAEHGGVLYRRGCDTHGQARS